MIIDLVINHTSDEHPWFLDARTGPKRARSKRGKDPDVFAVRVPCEHFTEELVSTDDGVDTVVAVRGGAGSTVDVGEVAPERLVGDEDEVEGIRTRGDSRRAHVGAARLRKFDGT